MKFTTWQLIVLIGFVIVGAQAPMFALAQSIGDDEAAKSALGWFTSGILGAIVTFVIAIYSKGRENRQLDDLFDRLVDKVESRGGALKRDEFDTMVHDAKSTK